MGGKKCKILKVVAVAWDVAMSGGVRSMWLLCRCILMNNKYNNKQRGSMLILAMLVRMAAATRSSTDSSASTNSSAADSARSELKIDDTCGSTLVHCNAEEMGSGEQSSGSIEALARSDHITDVKIERAKYSDDASDTPNTGTANIMIPLEGEISPLESDTKPHGSKNVCACAYCGRSINTRERSGSTATTHSARSTDLHTEMTDEAIGSMPVVMYAAESTVQGEAEAVHIHPSAYHLDCLIAVISSSRSTPPTALDRLRIDLLALYFKKHLHLWPAQVCKYILGNLGGAVGSVLAVLKLHRDEWMHLKERVGPLLAAQDRAAHALEAAVMCALHTPADICNALCTTRFEDIAYLIFERQIEQNEFSACAEAHLIDIIRLQGSSDISEITSETTPHRAHFLKNLIIKAFPTGNPEQAAQILNEVCLHAPECAATIAQEHTKRVPWPLLRPCAQMYVTSGNSVALRALTTYLAVYTALSTNELLELATMVSRPPHGGPKVLVEVLCPLLKPPYTSDLICALLPCFIYSRKLVHGVARGFLISRLNELNSEDIATVVAATAHLFSKKGYSEFFTLIRPQALTPAHLQHLLNVRNIDTASAEAVLRSLESTGPLLPADVAAYASLMIAKEHVAAAASFVLRRSVEELRGQSSTDALALHKKFLRAGRLAAAAVEALFVPGTFAREIAAKQTFGGLVRALVDNERSRALVLVAPLGPFTYYALPAIINRYVYLKISVAGCGLLARSIRNEAFQAFLEAHSDSAGYLAQLAEAVEGAGREALAEAYSVASPAFSDALVAQRLMKLAGRNRLAGVQRKCFDSGRAAYAQSLASGLANLVTPPVFERFVAKYVDSKVMKYMLTYYRAAILEQARISGVFGDMCDEQNYYIPLDSDWE